MVNPSFPYTVQLTSTVTILDTSISKIPNYVITPNKTKVIEGGNVVFNMSTTNVDDGTNIEYRIIADRYPDTCIDPQSMSRISEVLSHKSHEGK